MKKKILVLVAPLLLAACQGPMMVNSMDRAYCSPDTLSNIQRVRWGMGRIEVGQDRAQVQSFVGMADRWEAYSLTDGRQVEVMFYKVAEPACPTTLDGGPAFLPMVFHDGKLMGYGVDYYNNVIRPGVLGLTSQPTPPVPAQPAAATPAPYGMPVGGAFYAY